MKNPVKRVSFFVSGSESLLANENISELTRINGALESLRCHYFKSAMNELCKREARERIEAREEAFAKAHNRKLDLNHGLTTHKP